MYGIRYTVYRKSVLSTFIFSNKLKLRNKTLKSTEHINYQLTIELEHSR